VVLDAHAHLWRRDRTPQPWIDAVTMAPIDRDVWVDDLRALHTSTGISGSIVVQSSNTVGETVDLLAAASEPGSPILGVVGWIDLEADVEGQLEALASQPGGALLVGVRHLAHQDGDPEWLVRDSVHHGLEALADSGLVFDIVVRPEQLPVAARAVAAHPRLRVVLDHLGKPPIAAGDLSAWMRDLGEIAAHGSVSAKLSGLATEADWSRWSIDDLRPVTDAAIRLFGADRVMFGSDWPVVDLAGGVPHWLRTARELVDERHHHAVFGGTAASVYALGGSRA
jgi:L-fuconolactonase